MNYREFKKAIGYIDPEDKRGREERFASHRNYSFSLCDCERPQLGDYHPLLCAWQCVSCGSLIGRSDIVLGRYPSLLTGDDG